MELNLCTAAQAAIGIFHMLRYGLTKFEGQEAAKTVERATKLAQGQWSKIRVCDVEKEDGNTKQIRTTEIKVVNPDNTAVFRIQALRENILVGNPLTPQWSPWKPVMMEIRAQPRGNAEIPKEAAEKMDFLLYYEGQKEVLSAEELLAPMSLNWTLIPYD